MAAVVYLTPGPSPRAAREKWIGVVASCRGVNKPAQGNPAGRPY